MGEDDDANSRKEAGNQRGRGSLSLVAAAHAPSLTSQAPSSFKRFNSSPEVIRLVVLMYVRFPLSLWLRFRAMRTLQKFASVHANVHNHFSSECHLVGRQTYKARRSAALAEWQVLAS